MRRANESGWYDCNSHTPTPPPLPPHPLTPAICTQAEIVILGRLRHPNLARLIGYCHDNGEGLLVYEFVSRGSLEFHLFQELNSGLVPLSWTARLKVALDAAQGLAYLHDQNIIHRDFKAPNILLGDKFEAKLTDFGLANKSITADVTTYIMDQEDHGVMRYLDPNLLDGTTGRVTQKSDVYSFGVVLLELLSGRRAVKPGCQLLTEWAEEALAERRPNIKAFMDPYIYEEFKTRAEGRAACILAIVAKHCIAKQPDGRPLMCEVVETLCQLVEG